MHVENEKRQKMELQDLREIWKKYSEEKVLFPTVSMTSFKGPQNQTSPSTCKREARRRAKEVQRGLILGDL